MHTNYVILYDNLCYDWNTDSGHLYIYILREPPLALFIQLKPITFLLGSNLDH